MVIVIVSRASVYPRVCGGTSLLHHRGQCGRGLSPRVRGNRHDRNADFHIPRSIPACAGEPCWRCRLRPACGVYPRVCGGTPPGVAALAVAGGLSPRVRGNRSQKGFVGIAVGSIPACAGEPDGEAAVYAIARVYPRVCGGTVVWYGRRPFQMGLSPRVRGNLAGIGVQAGAVGSIPACAGEPGGQSGLCRQEVVYPRVCGGTVIVGQLRALHDGLSPRVRGNLGGW